MSALLQYLQKRGVTFVVIPHAPGRQASAYLRAHGLEANQVVKTVVLATRGGHALAVVPDPRELDLALAREAVGDPEARIATLGELELAFPDYEPGALPPLGLYFLAPMYVDPAVVLCESVVFRAGTHDLSIAMATNTLFHDDPVVVTPLTLESARLPHAPRLS
jgi:prolyl-tRNA editing enzyme YbaK/EbsC (Cys-tRNA(Pro) deacylase)